MCEHSKGIHAFRYGGDEFIIIYESMSDKKVLDYAVKLRERIGNIALESEMADEGITISISQGIRNSVPKETTKLWDYMYAADNALYQVKESRKGEIALIHNAVISQKSLDEVKHG